MSNEYSGLTECSSQRERSRVRSGDDWGGDCSIDPHKEYPWVEIEIDGKIISVPSILGKSAKEFKAGTCSCPWHHWCPERCEFESLVATCSILRCRVRQTLKAIAAAKAQNN